jgi:hypothetical protein
MDIGTSLISIGIDLRLLQGFLNQSYEESEQMQHISDDDYELDLERPLLETRDDGQRLGLHLRGLLKLSEPPAIAFDTWIELEPTPDGGDGNQGTPVGKLRYKGVEDTQPESARFLVEEACAPDGTIGSFLAAMEFPLFEPLLAEVSESQILGPHVRGAELMEQVSVDFYLGRPGTITRPLYRTPAIGYKRFGLELESVAEKATVPALIASVALAKQEAALPGKLSTVPYATGMQLIVSKTIMDAKLAQQAEAQIGTKLQDDVVTKSLSLIAGNAGIDIQLHGEGSKAEVDISGTIAARFSGGIGGSLHMVPAIQVSVEMSWWVEALSLICIAMPLLGWVVGDIFIWEPFEDKEESAPITSNERLSRQFNDALRPVAERLTRSLRIAPMASRAYLADVWFFAGNFAVSAAAFAGRWPARIDEITYDVAHVGRQGHLKPVPSVAELLLDGGQRLKPWHAGELAKLGILEIPHHHGVENHLARGGFYLRSNPNNTTADNLIQEPALS